MGTCEKCKWWDSDSGWCGKLRVGKENAIYVAEGLLSAITTGYGAKTPPDFGCVHFEEKLQPFQVHPIISAARTETVFEVKPVRWAVHFELDNVPPIAEFKTEAKAKGLADTLNKIWLKVKG